MITTSPNQEGVEGTEGEEVWMITVESVILFMEISLMRMDLYSLIKETHFSAGLLLATTSLRNSWAWWVLRSRQVFPS